MFFVIEDLTKSLRKMSTALPTHISKTTIAKIKKKKRKFRANKLKFIHNMKLRNDSSYFVF